MNKSTLSHRLKNIQRVKTWQLLVILLLAMLAAATLLRLNNLGMVERRSAVIVADESGTVEELKMALVELQDYVTHHMNAGMGNGIYLAKTYEQDRDAALKAASSSSNPNSKVYQQASIECRAKWQGGVESFRNDYVQCVIERVSALSPSQSQETVKLPKADNYKVNYSSPLWSPDLAGIAVALCALIIVVIVGRLVALMVLRTLVRKHYTST